MVDWLSVNRASALAGQINAEFGHCLGSRETDMIAAEIARNVEEEANAIYAALERAGIKNGRHLRAEFWHASRKADG